MPHSVPWNLSELKSIEPNGLRVFSCFHCGGGSTMGYKLAGFDVVGGVEIDRDMMEIYRKNHNPRLSFMMPIQEFKLMEIPEELREIDILDGSPPCSVFSMAGNREDDWGRDREFREGQSKQRLDDLFLHFIDVANKIRPKVVIAENVKGMLLGNAKGYISEIFKAFTAAGYEAQLFLLNASRMGVPQRRERVFFIARRADLRFPRLELGFSEPEIPCSVAFGDIPRDGSFMVYGETMKSEWLRTPPGRAFSVANKKGHHFNWIKVHPMKAGPTVASGSAYMLHHWSDFRSLTDGELIRLQSFPDDYDFGNEKVGYVTGMSVPPLMMERLALEVARQFFGKPYQSLNYAVVPDSDEADAHPAEPPAIP